MNNKLFRSLTGAAVALFFVCGLTFAKSSHINLIYRGQIGHSSVTLLPGKYKVSVDNPSSTPQMSFYQDGKLVGTAPVKLVTEANKNSQTEVFYSAPKDGVRHISQIDISGWRDRLMFNKAPSSKLTE